MKDGEWGKNQRTVRSLRLSDTDFSGGNIGVDKDTHHIKGEFRCVSRML